MADPRQSLALRRHQMSSGHTWDCWESAFQDTSAALGWWICPDEVAGSTSRRLETGQAACTCPLVPVAQEARPVRVIRRRG
jgi:hypothetical protein